jgi:RNA polymerase sigma-70 factor (ECF subfamily)
MTSQLLTLDDLLRHAGWLRRLAAGLLGDRDAGEDIAQETLVAAWRRPPASDRDVRPWLARVVANGTRDRARAESRRVAREECAQRAAGAQVSTPEQLVGEAQTHRMVAEIVSRLEQPFRETLVLRYYDGLSSADIARRLGVPPGTVRARLKRGLDRVRAELDARHQGDRGAWVRGLLPLLPVSPRAGWPLLLKGAALASGAAAVSLVIAVAVLAPSRQPAPTPRPSSRALALARSGGAGPARDPGGPSFPAAVTPVSGPREPALLDCQARLRRAHEELVALEADLLEWDTGFPFVLGEPNPTAERALAPLVRPLIEEPHERRIHLPLWRSPVLEHRLRCRTWACRLALRIARPSRVPERYLMDLASDPELAARVSRVNGGFEEWEDDLLERDDSQIYVLELRLRQPSGAPLPEVTLTPPARTLVLPPTAARCEAAAAALARELSDRRIRWERAEPLEQKFERSQEDPDPELARVVESRQPWFTNLLARTECRGGVCKQTNRYRLLGRTFWEKPAGRGRSARVDRGAESAVYHQLEPAR